MKTEKKRIYVAISGGVDSAVAAALLKERGYDVHGIFLREYDISIPSAFGDAVHCTQEGDRNSALAVAAALSIPFEEWDFRKEYKRAVVSYMLREYKDGRTPNPDMLCNSVIKFGLFLKRALNEGADYIATGHYARLRQEFQISNFKFKNKKNKIVHLLQAKDKNKDQTYFLSQLSQEQLRYCLFPIGNLLKPHVRKQAKEFGLPNWNRKDSQGICFIGKLSMKDFLKTAIPQRKGALMTADGKRVGTHDGAAFFTIGQRHGLGFSGGGEPYYVVGKDMKKNIVYVVHQKLTSHLYNKELTCHSVNWISGTTPKFPLTCTARTRYRQQLQRAIIMSFRAKQGIQKDSKAAGYIYALEMTKYLTVTFTKPQRAITPGQFVVFYKGSECIGAGIIE